MCAYMQGKTLNVAITLKGSKIRFGVPAKHTRVSTLNDGGPSVSLSLMCVYMCECLSECLTLWLTV